MKHRAGLRLRYVFAAVLCAVTAGCAEEEVGPQFANEPAPTRPATETPPVASPVTLVATPVAATPVSFDDVLTARGAPTRLYVATGNAIWTVSIAGQAELIYSTPSGERVVAVDAAPGGERVAVLLATEVTEGERTDVVIIDSGGEMVSRLDDLGVAQATPLPDQRGSRPLALDWSPQADRALVSFADGSIVDFAIGAEEIRAILMPSDGGDSIVNPLWSPTGESVAFIATNDDGRSRTLRILHVGNGAVADIVTPPEGRFVVEFAWMPDGVSLLFTEGGGLGGAVAGIDLWRVDADGTNRELVVSAGTVAPVARITNVQPSPDGRSVAYSVLIPGDGDPRVDSVWIRDLESGVGFRVQVPSVATVGDISWTDGGLAIDVTTESAGTGRAPTRALLRVAQGGSVSAIWAAALAGGTPVGGTPVAVSNSG